MRCISKLNPRLLAAVLSLSLLISGGTFFLAGCGGGSSNNPSNGSNSSYAGRSYTVNNLALADGRTAGLALQVSSGNVLTGVLTLTNPADTIALSGTLNRATGAFHLNGALTRDAGEAVTAEGFLPSPPGITGGSVSITIGGHTYTASFSISSSPNPTPTPSGGTGSPTPTPTPAGGTPTPTNSPGNGTLSDYYTSFSSNVNDSFTYQFTGTVSLNPDPNGDSSTSSDQGTIHGGILFGNAFAGQKTTVTINLPLSGSKTVTRQEQINPTTGAVFGYSYYTEDANGRTDYGDDSLLNGVVVSSTRYDNGERIPFTLSPGQSYSQNFTVFETQFDFTGTQTGQYSYVEQETITFVAIENLTVIGGTYSNVAHLRSQVSYTLPAAATTGSAEPTTENTEIYLSKFVGLVLSTNQTITQNMTGRVGATGDSFTYTETDDNRDELVSATVSGTNYPPGRSVKAFGGKVPKNSYLSPSRHRQEL